MSDEINVLALCRAKAGKEAETQALFASILEPTRREPGCLRYELKVDRARPTDFWFVETWANQAALDRHMTSPETAALVKKLETLLAEPATLITLSPIG